MKIYINLHCPYCISSIMVANISHLKYKIVYLAYDDEKSHIDRIGSKQVPFLELVNGKFIKESLDICEYIIKKQKLEIAPKSNDKTLQNMLNQLWFKNKHIVFPKFLDDTLNKNDFTTQHAKDYFIKKKDKYLGILTFSLAKKQQIIDNLSPLLTQINELMIHNFATYNELSYDDVITFTILRVIILITYLISIQDNIKTYLDNISKLTRVPPYD